MYAYVYSPNPQVFERAIPPPRFSHEGNNKNKRSHDMEVKITIGPGPTHYCKCLLQHFSCPGLLEFHTLLSDSASAWGRPLFPIILLCQYFNLSCWSCQELHSLHF